MSEIFQQHEYLHALINPVLTHALPLGALALIFAFFLRSRQALAVALVIVFLSSAAVLPTVRHGEKGADRVQSMADVTGGQWLQIHKARAERWIWLFLLCAASAAASLIANWKWPRIGRILTLFTLLLAITSSAMGGYIAWAGGKIRHKEFRTSPPPATELQKIEKSLSKS